MVASGQAGRSHSSGPSRSPHESDISPGRRRLGRGAPGAHATARRGSGHRSDGCRRRSAVRHGAHEDPLARRDRPRCGDAAHGRHHLPAQDHGRETDAGGDLLHAHRARRRDHDAGTVRGRGRDRDQAEDRPEDVSAGLGAGVDPGREGGSAGEAQALDARARGSDARTYADPGCCHRLRRRSRSKRPSVSLPSAHRPAGRKRSKRSSRV